MNGTENMMYSYPTRKSSQGFDEDYLHWIPQVYLHDVNMQGYVIPTREGGHDRARTSKRHVLLERERPGFYYNEIQVSGMSMMNIVREVYQEASDAFRSLIRFSKTTPALIRNLKQSQDGCKGYLTNRELTISLIPVEKYLDHIRQQSMEMLEKNWNALRCILRFALNLCIDPNREEYFVIKKYTAFFQCNVDGIFSFCDDLLGLFGYKLNPDADEYRLERVPDNVIDLTFNLFLTTIEFERVIEFSREAKKEGYSVSDCLQARKEINEGLSGWNATAGLKWLKEKEIMEMKLEAEEGFSKSGESERPRFVGNQYNSGDASGYRYGQDTEGDAYTTSSRDSSSKYNTELQHERGRADVNRSYSPMRGKETFYSSDRRASDNNYQSPADSYKGSMFLDNRNDISDHELYGDSKDSTSSDSKDHSSSGSSLGQTSRSSDMKDTIDMYNSSQYGKTADIQQYLAITDDRSRDNDSVEKLSGTSNYSATKLGRDSRELISDSDGRTSAILSGKDTVITSRVPPERTTGRSSSTPLQRLGGTNSGDAMPEAQSTSSVLFSDKTKDLVTTYDTSNCDTSSGKANYRGYDQSIKKPDRGTETYGKSTDSTIYGQGVSSSRFMQGNLVSVTRDPAIYRSTQSRGKPADVSSRGVNDFTNLQMPTIYKS